MAESTQPHDPDPEVGLGVVSCGLTMGRRIAKRNQERRTAIIRELIRTELDIEILSERQPWGRAGRIARKLHGKIPPNRNGETTISERQVRRYLAQLPGATD